VPIVHQRMSGKAQLAQQLRLRVRGACVRIKEPGAIVR
jgi:hypothetical protein